MKQLVAIHLSSLRGVGPRTTDSLAKAGLHNAWDLLLNLPTRYENRSFITPIANVVAGKTALFDGEIIKTWQQFAKRRMLCVKIKDSDSEITLRWFNFNAHQQQRLQPGVRVRVYGAPVMWQKHFEIIHPELEIYSKASPPPLSKHLRSVYRACAGVSKNKLHTLMQQALALLDLATEKTVCDEVLPANLPDIKSALTLLHNMPLEEYDLFLSGQHPAEKRLIMEELLAQLWFLRSQRAQSATGLAQQIKYCKKSEEFILQQFGYDLTASQRRSVAEICSDLERDKPMRRLLQGDVGSGKTAVAAVATLQVASNGLQSAWLAPTTVLAEQYASTLRNWFEPLGIDVQCFTSALKAKQKHEILERLESGDLLVVVGTHAIFQQTVSYKNLSFLVIDEQHRFGVNQRAALYSKGLNPHSLHMTATPIPRTLMQSWFAGVDNSQLSEKPSCRLPIITTVVSVDSRAHLLSRIIQACKAGGRVYWVCSLIDSDDANNVNAATDVFADLRQQFSGVKVGLVHGRMPDSDKQQALHAFASGDVQVLVATTVIEVGVDVPEATIIVIDNPERLGLAQLHQLRGRVGRSSQQSYCVLLAAKQLSPDAKGAFKCLA